ncbi:polyprenyl synthetase family protein [Methanolapillus ohkumae]|uniref:Heptaprenyl diphosphate synthase component 2 n=1 Tax=Methanolapillus ohkumae TaxID=3028298 RepID=A0AA96V6L9_9EURY|nr:Heptaprenyl diphosphate synthase component 2 [Methanosarcinaceae archaeon Am2]
MKIEEWDEYKHFINAITESLASISSSPALTKVTGYIFNTGGKKLRPLVIMLSCGAAGGDFKSTTNACLAVEAIHTASLAHDDILDAGTMRRNQPTIHEKYGLTAAILCGDFLIAKSIEWISIYNPQVVFDFGHSGVLLSEGEIIDASIKRGEMKAEEYLECIYKKTAALFEISAKIGSRIAHSNDEDAIEAFGTYGYEFGMAYQIVDDLLEDFGLYKDKESGVLSDSLFSIHLRTMPFAEAAKKTILEAEAYLNRAKEAIAGVSESPSKEKMFALADYVNSLMDKIRNAPELA